MDILEGGQIWRDRQKWPRGDAAHVFLLEALELIGSTIPDWDGTEGKPDFSSQPHTEEKKARWIAASDRLSAAIERLVAMATDPSQWVTTYSRPRAGGEYWLETGSIWNRETLWEDVFREGFLRRGNTGYSGGWHELYIFLNRQELSSRLKAEQGAGVAVPLAEADGVHLSPYVLIMVEASRRLSIGATAAQQPKTDALRDEIIRIADERSIELSPRLVASMATLLREPAARMGVKKMKADERRAQP